MTPRAKSLPERYTSVMAYLTVKDAPRAIEWYGKVFDAQELYRLAAPDGAVGHAEIRIGDTIVMLADESVAWGNMGPKELGGTPVKLSLFVDNVDEVIEGAVAAGATLINPPKDQFYGERDGRIEDPFGHVWVIGTMLRDVPPGEMQRLFEEWLKQQA